MSEWRRWTIAVVVVGTAIACERRPASWADWVLAEAYPGARLEAVLSDDLDHDDPEVRRGLRTLIDRDPDVEVRAAALGLYVQHYADAGDEAWLIELLVTSSSGDIVGGVLAAYDRVWGEDAVSRLVYLYLSSVLTREHTWRAVETHLVRRYPATTKQALFDVAIGLGNNRVGVEIELALDLMMRVLNTDPELDDADVRAWFDEMSRRYREGGVMGRLARFLARRREPGSTASGSEDDGVGASGEPE